MIYEPHEVFLVFCIFVVLPVILFRWEIYRTTKKVKRWSKSNGFTLKSTEYRFFRRGPFGLFLGRDEAVHRFVVSSPEGNEKSGWILCNIFWGNDVKVEWDEPQQDN